LGLWEFIPFFLCLKQREDKCKTEEVMKSQGGEEYPTYSEKRKTRWIGRTLPSKTLTEEKQK
jgi:hypothetical protein